MDRLVVSHLSTSFPADDGLVRSVADVSFAIRAGQTTALVTARADADVRSAEALTRVLPKDGGAYIELAQAYVRADRPADAAAAYRRALSLDNSMMETRTGDSVWSHNIARAALVRFPQMTAR